MEPVTLIAVAVLSIIVVWIAQHLAEPGRMIVFVVLTIALLLVILRLLGIW